MDGSRRRRKTIVCLFFEILRRTPLNQDLLRKSRRGDQARRPGRQRRASVNSGCPPPRKPTPPYRRNSRKHTRASAASAAPHPRARAPPCAIPRTSPILPALPPPLLPPAASRTTAAAGCPGAAIQSGTVREPRSGSKSAAFLASVVSNSSRRSRKNAPAWIGPRWLRSRRNPTRIGSPAAGGSRRSRRRARPASGRYWSSNRSKRTRVADAGW